MADSNGSGVGIANRDALITTDEALQHLSDAGYRFVEVDVDTTAYEKGHLPGAFGWNWKRDLQEQPVRDLASKEKLERLLSETGITPDTTVVLYGDNNNWFAAYAYWTLKYYGHDKVQLIDGGRSPAEYSGELLAPENLPQEGAQRGGHIPTAKNIPWAKAVKEDGTFKSPDELRQLYGGHGVTGQGETIPYCRIGERSAHTWFVLTELLGFPNVKNYDGSWTEWGSLIKAPIEK